MGGRMKNIFSAFMVTVILVGTLGALFGRASSTSAQPVKVLCAMKTAYTLVGTTPENGYFYVPTIPTQIPTYLKIEMLFNLSGLTGDQFGGASPYYPTNPTMKAWPDERVNMFDIGFIAKEFGSVEGGFRWDYMADVKPDRRINMNDIALAALSFGNYRPYLPWPQLGVTVSFNNGLQVPVLSDGVLAIPPEATYLKVSCYGIPIGALVTFWT
jgi:hypothetical protein